MNRVAVTLVLLSVAVGLVYVSLASDRARAPKTREAAPPRAEAEPELQAVALEPRARLPVKPEESPVDRVAEWKEARRARARVDLGASLSARGWKPWEVVEGRVQAAARTDQERERDREIVGKIIQGLREESEDLQAESGFEDD